MDYAPAGSLRAHYPKRTRLPLSLVVEYTRQMAEALQYAHDRRVIHRDVKPENMLIGQQEEILLSDFGIAIIAHSTASQSTEGAMGTFPYMAPEQINGKPRPASDQYSLGIVVYEWLTGDRPFHGTIPELISQHVFKLPPPLHEKVPEISPEVEQVVMTALAKEPQQRFPSVQDFATNLALAGDVRSASAFAIPPMIPQLTSPASSPGIEVSTHSNDTSTDQPDCLPTITIGSASKSDITDLTPTLPASAPISMTAPVVPPPKPANLLSETGSPPPRRPSIPHPLFRQSVFSYLLLTSILGILASIILGALGKLPMPAVYITIGIGLALALIILVWNTAKKLAVWKGIKSTSVYSSSIVTILALTALVLVSSPLLQASTVHTGKDPNKPIHSSSPVTFRTASANTTLSATSATTVNWHVIFRQVAPFCKNPQGVSWQPQASSAPE